ncbi:hypothetical protein D3C71_1399100 [compost metagenome]
MRQQAVRCGYAHLLPHSALMGFGAGGGMGFDVVQQCACCLGTTCAGQAVEVLQVQEGQHMVGQTLCQVVGYIGPAVVHIDTCKLQPRQQ